MPSAIFYFLNILQDYGKIRENFMEGTGMIKVVLFDLDGTLLPMDQENFTKTYFKLLAKKLAPHGYNADELISAVWGGTKAMAMNDGIISNEEQFWIKFSELIGDRALKDKPIFDEYYANEFSDVKTACGYNPLAKKAVDTAKSLGFRVALATNPLFPKIATESRIKWAGFNPEDFELFTTYENSKFCKPNPSYYSAIVENLEVSPQECLMVGNDVGEDMVAAEIGMNVFLLTDCLINKTENLVDDYPNGDFEALIKFLEAIGNS